ncbi:MAG: helix-hairpin-helix domain-containing protein [Nanoarchaeota archaeon]|nr:helix-hairpin-helix domain-containing protein [Nanoarchaeota archaeon]
MKSIILVIALILFLSLVSANCDKNQVDINSAPIEMLEEITGVGPIIAQNIINTRPYVTLDDMIKVNRIGEITLQKIKDQGLACVDEDVQEKEIEEIKVEPIIHKEEVIMLNKNSEPILLNKNSESELVYISKNAKVTDNLVYAFSIFLIFIIGILIWERF